MELARAGTALEVHGQDIWIDVQQSRALGTCGHPPPWLTSVMQARCEEGGFHLCLIFSQLRVTKHSLKRQQSRSPAKSSWAETFCTSSATYRGCHIQRGKKKCGLSLSGGPGNAFLSCSYEMRAVVIPGYSALK